MECVETRYVPYHADSQVGSGRALVLAPHPDDEVLGCAGAIMRHVERSDPVKVVVLTDGAFGAGNRQAEVTRRREAESREAGKILGYGEPEFWRIPDRGLAGWQELSGELTRVINEFSPEWVYIPSWWEIHPDHVAVARGVTDALRQGFISARLAMYEVGMPLQPNCLLDITELLERKRVAIACFGSQLVRQAYDAQILALNRFRTYTLPATVAAAEGYRRVSREETPEHLSIPWVLENNRP